jgi:hypothetical protein
MERVGVSTVDRFHLEFEAGLQVAEPPYLAA